ncbi:hypothetical protein INT44_000617 [Umbelopsis vinacea]|uniref:Ricin B lectin domain-containing protein n=1 Tax=Umbelopsis vinacea TaxID=44442 RepID=A0A8H7UN54_9FUNG|nr:hypothetical protein INT44_000617 [Umbelopsis vinacea]
MSPVFPEWFRMRSLFNGYVVTIDRSLINNTSELVRSQVYLCPAQNDAYELWQWDGQYLINKATKLVLDIRKGRLRLIEDTEICLYTPKPAEKAMNQRWTTRQCTDDLGREQNGIFICSLSNDEWVLDVQHTHASQNPKLLLYPAKDFDNESQLWEFEAADYMSENIPSSVSSSIDQLDISVREISPSKRGSNSSIGSGGNVEAFKEAHMMVYLEHQPHVSDKTIGMAAAYQALQQWKLQQVEALTTFDNMASDEWCMIQKRLQLLAENEAALIYQRCDQLNNNPQTAESLAAMLVLKLYEQQPATP